MDTPKLGIIAALEREVAPLVRGWATVERMHDGRTFKFYEKEDAVLVCGGIGPGPARRATEALCSNYQLESVQSVGYAGALTGRWKVGAVMRPARVVDMEDGSSVQVDSGAGVLLTASSVIGAENKAKLAAAYHADAVDMEAAAVAKGAEARRIPFSAMKAISDENTLHMPPTDRFVTTEGKFQSGRFAIFALVRPWLWGTVLRLAQNSKRATISLCQAIEEELEERSHKVIQSA